MITHLKSEAPPADKTEGAMIYLNNDSVDAIPRITEAETSHVLCTPSAG